MEKPEGAKHDPGFIPASHPRNAEAGNAQEDERQPVEEKDEVQLIGEEVSHGFPDAMAACAVRRAALLRDAQALATVGAGIVADLGQQNLLGLEIICTDPEPLRPGADRNRGNSCAPFDAGTS
jgi:hypothetical protein